MKIFAYDVREDEQRDLERLAEQYQLTIGMTELGLSPETVALATGFDGVTILTDSIASREVLKKLAAENIFYLSTRSVGYEFIDLVAAKELGIKVCNAVYPPNSVADFAIMLMLMTLRHAKSAIARGNVNDFSVDGLQGRLMKDLTVGIIGAGNIGGTVIKNLTGFGCKIKAYDVKKNVALEKYAAYVSLDELLATCDMISVHTPLTEDTYHLINQETVGKMKDGVILINTARGGIMETEVLIEGIESGKISALGLDVLEEEGGIFLFDRRLDILENRKMAYLRQFPNVTMTHHLAFYTDNAVRYMVEYGVLGLKALFEGGQWEYEVKG